MASLTDAPYSSPAYQALDQTRKEFRVLIVAPGADTDPIRCRFQTASLLSAPLPQYETVSYAWGDAWKCAVVLIDGHALDVPLSVKQVLDRMRRPDKERTVWIDFLCIDQKNLQERTYLVQMMCEIYSRTTAGFVWLGEDDVDALKTFGAFNQLYEEARRETRGFSTFKETVWPGWWSVYGTPTSVDFDAAAIARVFGKLWFSRLWCVQEAALAPNSVVHCGQHSLPLLKLLRAAIWLYNKGSALPEPLRREAKQGLSRAVHIASYADPLFKTPFQTANDLLWLMRTLRQYDASVDKDHVYGLIGLYQRFSTGELPRAIVPEYSRSVRDIYCDATKLGIVEQGNSDALLYVCHRSTEEVERNVLPTWMTQWQRKEDLGVDFFPLNYKGFKASGSSGIETELVNGRPLDTLTMKGFGFDHVLDFARPFSLDALQSPTAFIQLCTSAKDLLANLGPGQHGDFAHTLVASLDHRRSPTTREVSMTGFESLARALETLHRFPSPTDEQAHSGVLTARTYHEALMRWLRNRCFFTTRDRRIGIGPKVMKKADLVAILFGCSVPMVLRPAARKHAFFVVGQAYVDGVMSGGALEHHRLGGAGDEVFHLV